MFFTLFELEPPEFGNHNKEFLKNRYAKHKTFSFSMMEDVAKFCGKIPEEAKSEISV